MSADKSKEPKPKTAILKPVYYLCGTDDLLIELEAARLTAAALKPGMEAFNYEAFDGKYATATQVLNAAYTLPAFSDRRVVVVKAAETIKAAEAAAYCDYFKDPSATTCLIFVSVGKADERAALVQAVKKAGYQKILNRMDDDRLAAWAINEANRQGKVLSEDASKLLITVTGTRLRDVKGELDKLILYVGEKTTLDEKEIEECCSDCREESGFALTDAISEKNVGKALAVFKKVSDEEPLKLLGSIARQIRLLLKLKTHPKVRISPDELAKACGIPSFFLSNYTRSAARFTEAELITAVGRLRAADTDLKTGRTPQNIVLPRLIMELCGSGGKVR